VIDMKRFMLFGLLIVLFVTVAVASEPVKVFPDLWDQDAVKYAPTGRGYLRWCHGVRSLFLVFPMLSVTFHSGTDSILGARDKPCLCTFSRHLEMPRRNNNAES
jgi:hypothetical protein